MIAAACTMSPALMVLRLRGAVGPAGGSELEMDVSRAQNSASAELEFGGVGIQQSWTLVQVQCGTFALPGLFGEHPSGV